MTGNQSPGWRRRTGWWIAGAVALAVVVAAGVWAQRQGHLEWLFGVVPELVIQSADTDGPSRNGTSGSETSDTTAALPEGPHLGVTLGTFKDKWQEAVVEAGIPELNLVYGGDYFSPTYEGAFMVNYTFEDFDYVAGQGEVEPGVVIHLDSETSYIREISFAATLGYPAPEGNAGLYFYKGMMALCAATNPTSRAADGCMDRVDSELAFDTTEYFDEGYSQAWNWRRGTWTYRAGAFTDHGGGNYSIPVTVTVVAYR